MSLSAQRYKKGLVKTISQWAAAHEEIENFHLEKPLDEEKREEKWEEILQYGEPPMDIPSQWVYLDVESWIQYHLWCSYINECHNENPSTFGWQQFVKKYFHSDLFHKVLQLDMPRKCYIGLYKYFGISKTSRYISLLDSTAELVIHLVDSHGLKAFNIVKNALPEKIITDIIIGKAIMKGSEEHPDWWNFEHEVNHILRESRIKIANTLWHFHKAWECKGEIGSESALSLMYGKDIAYASQGTLQNIRLIFSRHFFTLPPLKVKTLKKVFQAYNWEDPSISKGLINAVVLFAGQADQWIQKTLKLGRTVHDAVYFLPQEDDKRLASLLWDGLKRGKSTSDMDMLSSSWNKLSEEDKDLGFNEILKLVRGRIYLDHKDAAFAQEAARWGVSKKEYPDLESRYIRSLTQPDFYPEVKVEYKGLKGYFLRRNDPRGLFLGQHTDCCQHPFGAGKACAWYGQEQENSGFFVVEDKGSIIAQSWTWENDDEGICFDNVEAKSLLGDRSPKVFRVYEEAARQLWENNSFKAITAGRGANDLPELDGEPESEVQLDPPKDFSGHTDCGNQFSFFTNPDWEGGEDPEYFISGLLEDELENCEEVAAQVYPEGWQFAGSEESDCGFAIWVLEEEMYHLVGYATIESQNRYISDMAVLPEYRKYSLPLIRKVLDFCSRFDGEWEVDARESTSYRLLKLMDRRGRLTLLSEEESEETIAGERMIKVRFSC